MLLSSPTPEDLDFLRKTITRAFPNIMYVALYRVEDGPDYHVFAHANDKLSGAGWKKMVHERLENIVECEDMKAVLKDAMLLETFEEFGASISRAPRGVKAPPAKKVQTRSIGTQTDPVVFADQATKPYPGYRDYGAEIERDFRMPELKTKLDLPPYKRPFPYLTARKYYLRESGVEVPDDYDTSIEKSREFEKAFRIQATSGSIGKKKPRKGVPKRLVGRESLSNEEDNDSS